MDKTKKVIQFYLLANRLKNKIRSGWKAIDVQKERLESVAEHIYGTLMLAVALDSEYDLQVDMNKVFKMLILHELEEIVMPDYMPSQITAEEKIIAGKEAVKEVTKGLIKAQEIESLLDEFNAHESKESLLAYQIDKLECDLQAKSYDMENALVFENVKQDAKYLTDKDDIIKNAVHPSDIWIEVDRHLYKDEMFLELLNAIKNYKE